MRVKAVGDLVVDTHKTLKGFTQDRKKMGEDQAKDLAVFVKALTTNVGDMLKGFQKEHMSMSEEQAKALSNFVQDLTKDVGGMMKFIATAHKDMAKNLKSTLGKGEADRIKDFKAMIGNIQKSIKDIETYVAEKLKEFQDAHAEMSEQQKKDLAQYVNGIANEVKKLLGDYRDDVRNASSAWKEMASSLARSRKGGVMPRIEAGEKIATVEEAIEKKPKKKKGKKKGRKKKKA